MATNDQKAIDELTPKLEAAKKEAGFYGKRRNSAKTSKTRPVPHGRSFPATTSCWRSGSERLPDLSILALALLGQKAHDHRRVPGSLRYRLVAQFIRQLHRALLRP
jgi:hypothetical protein